MPTNYTGKVTWWIVKQVYVGLVKKKLVARGSFGIDSLLARSLVNWAVNEPAR
jgi:hypothetical protein